MYFFSEQGVLFYNLTEDEALLFESGHEEMDKKNSLDASVSWSREYYYMILRRDLLLEANKKLIKHLQEETPLDIYPYGITVQIVEKVTQRIEEITGDILLITGDSEIDVLDILAQYYSFLEKSREEQ